MMGDKRLDLEANQIILQTASMPCGTSSEVVTSEVFKEFLHLFLDELEKSRAPVLDELGPSLREGPGRERLIHVISRLHKNTLDEVIRLVDGGEVFRGKERALRRFVEKLYDYWRSFDRFMVLRSFPDSTRHDQRPHRTFNVTVQAFQKLIRVLYRDVQENITGDHPRVYRQMAAGCNVGLIATPMAVPMPTSYAVKLYDIPIIRQILITPPLILDPPTNTRSGRFERVPENPLDDMQLDGDRFLCYPAQVGPLVVLVYFHKRFIGLGTSLANLFELARDEQLTRRPDAVYVFGAPPENLVRFGEMPTVFYDDDANGLLAGFVPLEDRFGYFGYLKKMVLTLHNIAMMKRGRLPFHGAMTNIHLPNGRKATVLLIGDTATGKSETLEALRQLGTEYVRELVVVADDMGSLAVARDGRVMGYGTETGAFIRLDDLQQGYAFGQIDRAIIMSPHRVNARVILPVTTLEEVLHGYPIHILLYANNYEDVDDTHPVIERFETSEEALVVFREGKSVAKGTTTSRGMGQCYFANAFGAPQYRSIHDDLARETFHALMSSGAFIGQLRTRLGIPGFEMTGPTEASRALLDLINRQSE